MYSTTSRFAHGIEVVAIAVAAAATVGALVWPFVEPPPALPPIQTEDLDPMYAELGAINDDLKQLADALDGVAEQARRAR